VLTRNLANYTTGVVRIKISGIFPEKFINLCLNGGIMLWGIKKVGEDIYAYVRLPDFFAIREPAFKSHNKVRIVGVRGLPFTLKRFKQRKMMLAGAVLFFILLEVLTSYIWFIDIDGVKTVSGDRVKDIAASNGLRTGVFKNDVNVKEIESQILLNMPEVAWVGVKVNGTRALIEIVEKTLPRIADKAPADIVAAKDGVITEIIAIAGQAVVKKGDTVSKGDILVRGVNSPPPQSDGQNTVQGAGELIRANGIIKARIWYDSYGESGLVREEYRRTGRKVSAVTVKVGGAEMAFKKVIVPPFARYETEVIHKKLPEWRNSDFTVESTINIYHEVATDLYEISFDEARELAKAKAFQALVSKIPETAQVLVSDFEVLKTSESGLVRVKVSTETIEDIGLTMNITQ